MDKAQFWQMIEQTYDTDTATHSENLKVALLKMAPAEILVFDKIYTKLNMAAFRWELWAVAHIIASGCSQDGFMDFRALLIRQGREFYEAMLCQPEAAALRHNIREKDFIEMFGHESFEAYEELTGRDMPDEHHRWRAEPSGKRWKNEELEELYPRLCEKFG